MQGILMFWPSPCPENRVRYRGRPSSLPESSGNAQDLLRYRRLDRVICQATISVVREARTHLVDEPDRPLDRPEQHGFRVRSDRSAGQRGGHLPAPTPLKCEGHRLTLYSHRYSDGCEDPR